MIFALTCHGSQKNATGLDRFGWHISSVSFADLKRTDFRVGIRRSALFLPVYWGHLADLKCTEAAARVKKRKSSLAIQLPWINDAIPICNSIGCKFKRSELDTDLISLRPWLIRHHMREEAKNVPMIPPQFTNGSSHYPPIFKSTRYRIISH